jgi:hypothetical protein
MAVDAKNDAAHFRRAKNCFAVSWCYVMCDSRSSVFRARLLLLREFVVPSGPRESYVEKRRENNFLWLGRVLFLFDRLRNGTRNCKNECFGPEHHHEHSQNSTTFSTNNIGYPSNYSIQLSLTSFKLFINGR